MEDITDKEKLALLGFDDPQHSLVWYKERFKNLPEILEQYIVDTLNQCGIFPKEAKDVVVPIRYHKFYLIVEVIKNNYIVKINNTDRREVQKEHVFGDIREAAKFLINKSFTMGGSIRQHWEIS